MESGLIDYSDCDDDFRANSVLEKYNCHVKDSLPRNSNWPKFLSFLVEEEANFVKELLDAERKGIVATKSVRFGETYLPKPLQKQLNTGTTKTTSSSSNSTN